MSKKPVILVDFDDTCSSGFDSDTLTPFPPNKDCKWALTTLSKFFEVVIFSVRAKNEVGVKCISDYMTKYALPYSRITNIKEMADFYVDNAAIRYETWKQVIAAVATLETKHTKSKGKK